MSEKQIKFSKTNNLIDKYINELCEKTTNSKDNTLMCSFCAYVVCLFILLMTIFSLMLSIYYFGMTIYWMDNGSIVEGCLAMSFTLMLIVEGYLIKIISKVTATYLFNFLQNIEKISKK